MKIDQFIQELQDDGMMLTKEEDAFHFLGVNVIKHPDGKVELLQVRLIEKVLKTLGMESCTGKDTPDTNSTRNQCKWRGIQ